MAVRESLRNIQELQTASLELKKQKEAERKRKEKERQQKQEEKETKERIKQEINSFLYQEFINYLIETDSTHIYEFYSIEKKNNILEELYKQYTTEITENKIKFNYIEHKNFITNHFNNNYYKILKKAEDEAIKNEEYLYYNALQHCQEQQEEQQQQQIIITTTNINTKAINKTINTILIILLAIVCFPVAIVIAACKNQK